MFELFKKKEEKPEEIHQAAGDKQFVEFAAQFLPEDLDILAVTGANSFGGGHTQEDELWTASIGLTAWMEEDTDEIYQGKFTLTTPGNEALLRLLRQRASQDSVIKFRGRVSEDGSRLLLLDLPEPGFDPELEAILEEQIKPVTFFEDGLGTFTLNRQVDWFETRVDWLGTAISLVFDVEENRADVLRNAKTLLAGAAEWDGRIRAFTAGELVETINGLLKKDAEEAGDQEAEVMTREDLMARIALESIEIRADGSFEFWFSDSEKFYGDTIHVSGGLENGPNRAEMER